ncbi:hypothetical protein GCM10023321_70320 [Pseudonocardia eucalypti]|uniref:Uncharacterized protein n=1 Tax=Pseudonocardia eucalypti TaxID=648755 RepID=A0ABP9R4Z7_9PSEU
MGAVGEPVVDGGALAAGGHQSGLFEYLQVRRGGGQSEVGDLREVGHGARALGEQVQQLQAFAVGEGFAYPGELFEQLGLDRV